MWQMISSSTVINRNVKTTEVKWNITFSLQRDKLMAPALKLYDQHAHIWWENQEKARL